MRAILGVLYFIRIVIPWAYAGKCEGDSSAKIASRTPASKTILAISGVDGMLNIGYLIIPNSKLSYVSQILVFPRKPSRGSPSTVVNGCNLPQWGCARETSGGFLNRTRSLLLDILNWQKPLSMNDITDLSENERPAQYAPA